MQRVATICCPNCQGTKEETMPVDSCLVLYTCTHCGAILRPKVGDCCVFCSYSDQVCPPLQQQDNLGAY